MQRVPTGSARYLGGIMIGADIIKNEITAHAVATSRFVAGCTDDPGNRRTGLQDYVSCRDGIGYRLCHEYCLCRGKPVHFWNQQSARLCIPIEDFGELALKISASAYDIAGRCAVFSESDHDVTRQQHRATVNIEDNYISSGCVMPWFATTLNNIVGNGQRKFLPPHMPFREEGCC